MDRPVQSPFTLQTVVRFTHTDPAGYVFFPRYFEMLQAVVEDWFTEALGIRYAEFILGRRLGTPTARIECNFLAPCRLGEHLDLTVYLEHVGSSSMRLRFIGSVLGERRLEAVSTLVVIGLDDGRPRRIDDALRARLGAYQASQGVPAHERIVRT
ncbi:MAG TPA: thioesterase family protein [Zeimonas sp.]|jgi:4-hydroxybenzoyl-CoA thioesterase|nr:thioesterase family protein [Zeimonas sp.]